MFYGQGLRISKEFRGEDEVSTPVRYEMESVTVNAYLCFILQVQSLTSECLEESRRVSEALEREQALRTVASEEKAKHLEAMKELEEAKDLLAKEAYERQLADLNASKESVEKQKIVDTLLTNDRRYRRYTPAEIEAATNFFEQVNVIGEGGYGKVYRCSLDHTPVAIKVLQHDVFEKKDEFLKEVSFAAKGFQL